MFIFTRSKRFHGWECSTQDIWVADIKYNSEKNEVEILEIKEDPKFLFFYEGIEESFNAYVLKRAASVDLS